MKKWFTIVIYLVIGPINLFAQSSSYKELLFEGANKEVIELIRNEVPEMEITGDIAKILAQAYEGLLKYREAYTYYNRWLHADTLHIDALNATARMALQLGRMQEGEALYLKAYDIDSTHFNTGLQLAKLNYQLKRYDRAYDYYYALLLQDTTNVNLLTNVGDCLNEMGDLSAILFYEEAVALNLENASLAIALINILLGYRELEPDVFINRSMIVCDTALVYNPGHNALLRSKGVIHYLAREYFECDSVMRGLIASGDSSVVNFKYVCLANYSRNIFYPALPYMEYYYQSDPTNIEAVMMLAVSLGRTYDQKRAIALFDYVEKLMQHTEDLVYNLATQRGIVFAAMQNISEASKYYWQAAGAGDKRRRAGLRNLVGLYYFDEKRLEQASPELYARGLFAHVAFMRDMLDRSIDETRSRYWASSKSILSLFLEDMFFKDLDRLQMWAPDGNKEWITREELRQLIKDE